VAAREHVAFVPALERVLGEHFQDAAVNRQLTAVGILRQVVSQPQLLAGLVDRVELVRCRLVGTENPERRHVPVHDVAQEVAQRPCVLGGHLPRLLDVDGVVAEIRQAKRLADQPAVDVGVRAHAARPFRRQGLQLRDQSPVGVEQLVGSIATQPAFELCEMGRVLAQPGQRHLVGAPEALHLVTVDLLRAGPALGCAQHDHRPGGAAGRAARPRLFLDPADLEDAVLQGGGHRLVHALGIVAFHEMGRPSVALEQARELLARNPREHRRVVDLVAVEVKDRQDRAVADRVQELVGVPRGRQRSGLRFPVSHHHRDQQIRVVEGGAEGVGDAVAQLAALVDGARSLGRAVATDAARE